MHHHSRYQIGLIKILLHTYLIEDSTIAFAMNITTLAREHQDLISVLHEVYRCLQKG